MGMKTKYNLIKFLKGYKKCLICNKQEHLKNIEVLDVKEIGIYGYIDHTIYYHYHNPCLKSAILEPEKYDTKTVDIALHITNILELKRNEEKQEVEKEKESEMLKELKEGERQEKIEKAQKSIENLI